jgi:hypothetical protein
MKIARKFVLLINAFILAEPVLIDLAKAETIEERCLRSWKDNGTYRTCIANETAKDAKPLEKRACSAQACYYRLSCTDGAYQTCTGEGYQVVFSQGDPGTDIVVRDPDGKNTKFGQYGTTGIEYESGPLKKAKLRFSNHDLILEVPK